MVHWESLRSWSFASLVSGWWFQPLWKIWKSMGRTIPYMKWKIKNVWNHQPGMFSNFSSILIPSKKPSSHSSTSPWNMRLSINIFGWGYLPVDGDYGAQCTCQLCEPFPKHHLPFTAKNRQPCFSSIKTEGFNFQLLCSMSFPYKFIQFP